jgi:hypothetical protein
MTRVLPLGKVPAVKMDTVPTTGSVAPDAHVPSHPEFLRVCFSPGDFMSSLHSIVVRPSIILNWKAITTKFATRISRQAIASAF